MRAPAPETTIDRRHRVVLWALAIARPHALTTDQIAEVLWPGPQPPTRDKVVQGSISALRKVCGRGAIETTAAGYRLAPDVVTASGQFERHVARARRLLAVGHADRAAALLTDTIGSWTGPPYAELSHWSPAVAEQARLTELTSQAEELLLQSLLEAGRVDEALPLARSLTAAEPLRESRWLSFATAAYLTGNQSAALEALRECRRTLREELGVDPSEELHSLEVAILRHDPSLSAPPRAAPSPTCPWPGLRAFQQEDAEGFFGRDADIARALEVLDATGSVAVAGPSGIGKSSFLRAGLAASLADAGLRVHVSTPLLGHPDDPVDVLVLDQAEELFDLPHADAAALLRRWEDAPVVLAIRTDRLADASAFPALAGALERSLFLLGPIGPEGLREAVERPAEQEGLWLEPGLVELLLRDVGGDAAALPMFSHAMAETWLRREGRTLTIDGYLAAGGVRGAITQTAEALYDSLDAPRREQLRSLLLRLVSTQDGGETTRARVHRRAVPVPDGLVDQLVASRLLTSDDDTLTLTHEALITAWPRLRDWLADDVEGRRRLQHLAQAAQTWEAMGRPTAELYRGQRLDAVSAWASSTPLRLADTERAFLAASQAEQVAEQHRDALALERERRTSRRLRLLVVGLACAAALAVAAGAVAVDRQRRSDIAARRSAAAATEADANRVGAMALGTDDAQLSLLLATAARQLAPGLVTNRTLSAALAARPELIATGDTGTTSSSRPVRGLASSGARVFALDDRHVLTVLTAGLRALGTIDLGDGQAQPGPAPLAAGNNLVAVGGSGGVERALVLVDPLSLRPVPVTVEGLPRDGVTVTSLHFSGDGQALGAVLTHGDDHLLMVWAVPSGKLLGPPVTLPRDTAVRLSDDGREAFTSDPVRAYRVHSGTVLWQADRASAGVLDARGTLVALPTADGTRVDLIDASTGRHRRTLTGIDGAVVDVAFTPNGGSLAATTSSGGAHVWDLSTGRVAHRLDTGATGTVAISSTGDTLFTGGGRPGSLLAWDLHGARSFLERVPRDGFQPVVDGTVHLSENGSWLAMSTTRADRRELRVGAVGEGVVRVVTPRSEWRGVGTWLPGTTRYAYADGDGDLTVVDAHSSAPPSGARVTSRPIVHLAAADADTVVTVDEGNQLVVVDSGTLAVRGRTTVPGRVLGLSAAGRRALMVVQSPPSDEASAAPASWQVLDLGTVRVVAGGDVPTADASVVSLSPDGAHLAVGSGTGAVAVLDVPARTVTGSEGPGTSASYADVAWSPDSRRMVSTVGLTLKLWDARQGRPTAQVRLPAAERGSVAAFAPDGTITVATLEGNIFRWNPAPDAAVAFACRVVGRALTDAEWRDAFGPRAFRQTC